MYKFEPGANLRGANLRGANLRDADLQGADLDFSCLPLWCGSLRANFDEKQITQFLYHSVKAAFKSKNISNEFFEQLSPIINVANRFHRVEECGSTPHERWESK